MITRPTIGQLVDTVREELERTVVPAIEDDAVRATLGMIDWVLGTVARRSAGEVAWMREEVAEIEALAAELIDGAADPAGAIVEALGTLRAARSETDVVADVQREYDHAGEVLGRCAEAAFGSGDALAAVQRVLQRRVDREIEIRGTFEFIGRG